MSARELCARLAAAAEKMPERSDNGPLFPLPASDDDPRFNLGLVLDVADVLVAHGYPRPASTDWAELQQALFRFLYLARH